MTLPKPAQVTLRFVDCINARDLEGLTALMSEQHTFVDLAGDEQHGRVLMRAGWQSYFSSFPHYRIYLARIFVTDDTVTLIGRTTGSHLGLPDEVEFQDLLIWVARVEDERVAEWRLYPDTPENRKELGVSTDQEVFEVDSLAATIDTHLRLLPEGARTPDIRAVRQIYTRQLKRASADQVVGLVERLRFQYEHRFVPYELLFYHKPALRSLDAEQVERLGQGIHNWSSTDIFAHFVAGPAWKDGRLSDERLYRWANSPDVWWRRAALVSTVYLDGDTQRTLAMCRTLMDDKHDMIVKAMSWALRALIAYDRQAVESFLAENDDVLAARVKREVRNKLETGLKNPRRK
jgi:3-methyladenine DNA glycosylase AlkD/ketosteroid isomerase-like protein